MPNRLPDSIPQVSSRIHYLILKGRLILPAIEQAQIIKQKFEIQTVLKWLLGAYFRLLSTAKYAEAREVLYLVRAAQESCFEELFERYGYPDELEPGTGVEQWLALAEACGVSVRLPRPVARALNPDLGRWVSFADMVSENGVSETQVAWLSDPGEVEKWRELIHVDRTAH